MLKKTAFFLILLFNSIFLFAQQINISGYIKDEASGEDMPGATIQIKGSTNATTTNSYGYYSLTTPRDSSNIILIISFIGYKKIEQRVNTSKNIKLNIKLKVTTTQLKEVTIEAKSEKDKINSTQMSVTSIPVSQIKEIPALMGEVDVLKVLQLTPGVQSGTEGSTGLNVRGGGADQNLIILDEATVYNASHLLGFFSVFNADAVKSIDLYKGGFPAKYSGRLSSVVDIKMKDGNKKKFSGAGGLGLISSRLTLEGPIKKDKASFIISGRRNYFDLITKAINKAREGDTSVNPIPNYFFYDLNAKVNYEINENNRLFLSGYFGKDVFKFNNEDFNFDFLWGNVTSSLRWNHLFSPKLFSNTTLIVSNYNYNITNEFDQFKFTLGSNIRDYVSKLDFEYMPNNKHRISFGVHYNYHQFTPSRISGNSRDSSINFNSVQKLNAQEIGLYAGDDFDLTPLWKVNAGLRVSGFITQGEFYHGVEPRLSIRYKPSDIISFKAGYSRMFQYVHLISNSGVSLPTDIWYPSTKIVKPQESNQIATGITALLFKEKFTLTNEIYYKWLNKQVDFKNGANLFVNDNLDGEFVFGKGWAYGNEIQLEKTKGKTTGWISYTLSWSWRKFPNINFGQVFHPRYDRRHDISIIISHKFTDRLSGSFSWVYGTGAATTLPIGRFYIADVPGATNVNQIKVIPEFQLRNSFRMPAYHRMDIGLTWKFKTKKLRSSELTFNLFNSYSRRNAFFIFFDQVEDKDGNPTSFQAKLVSLFPIIPSLTYNFKF